MSDFTNSTYSAMISFISMVIGLAYPLLLQAINRIDDTYHDDLMINRFRKEELCGRFNKWLFVTLGIGFTLPPLLYVLGDIGGLALLMSFILICLQLLVTCILIVTAIQLYQLVMTYYTTRDLLEHLKKKQEVDLAALWKIMQRAAESDNESVYIEARECLYSKFGEYQSTFYLQEGMKRKPIEFTDEHHTLFYAIVKATIKKDQYNFLADDNRLVGILYQTNTENIVSEKTLKFLWWAVNCIIDADCEKWFQQYWMNAEQYHRFILENPQKDVERRIRERFSQMHFMMGALLLYKNKYSWLKFILRYTQAQTDYNPFVLTSFVYIWD